MSSSDGEDGMKNLADKAPYERLEKELAAVKDDISTLTTQITDALNALGNSASKQARQGYKQARASADTVLSDVTERGSAAFGAAQDAARTAEESLEDAIRQRPIAAIGLAVGLGFLIGVTWRR
jgi:ElaB/YqjD/DUF883 family membrane-anchored ribosome-binding protein